MKEDKKKASPEMCQVRDKECEEIVLGTVINTVGVLEEIREFLSSDCFYYDRHREIWNAIVSIADRGDSPDLISVSAELRKMGSAIAPFELVSITRSSAIIGVHQHALRLNELNTRRQMWLIGNFLMKAGSNECEELDEIRQSVKDKIDSLFSARDENVFTLGSAFGNLLGIMKQNMNNPGQITGTATGFSRLDERGGLQKSNLVIVAGETSMGKTSFAMAITLNAIQAGAKVAVYSMEMTKEEISARMASMKSGVPANEILYSKDLSVEQVVSVDNAIRSIKSDNMFFDDRSTSNIDTILVSIRSLKIKHDIDGVVIDYLQILNVNMKNSNKEQAMGEAARRLKNLAKELNIWIIALSQLNRDSANPFPTLNRLRDSGQIAEASDIVLLLYRPEYYHKSNFPEPFQNADVKGKAMIEVAKGRNIGTMRFVCKFNPRLTLFEDLKGDIEEIDSTYEQISDAPF